MFRVSSSLLDAELREDRVFRMLMGIRELPMSSNMLDSGIARLLMTDYGGANGNEDNSRDYQLSVVGRRIVDFKCQDIIAIPSP